MENKKICYKCAGVVNDNSTNYASGEYPCNCSKSIDLTSILISWLKKKAQKRKMSKIAGDLQLKINCENGREIQNSKSNR